MRNRKKPPVFDSTVNSDEEVNGILDEVQQEKFISAMNQMASDYMQSWKRLFSWLSLVVIYINILALVGFIPLTRSFVAGYTPRSFTVQSLLSPVWVGAEFFGHPWPFCLQFFSVILIFIVAQRSLSSTRGGQTLVRLLGILALGVWLFASFKYTENWIWGRHTVLVVSLPLLCLAADTYLGARDLAVQGIEKLTTLKYSHRKV